MGGSPLVVLFTELTGQSLSPYLFAIWLDHRQLFTGLVGQSQLPYFFAIWVDQRQLLLFTGLVDQSPLPHISLQYGWISQLYLFAGLAGQSATTILLLPCLQNMGGSPSVVFVCRPQECTIICTTSLI